MELLSELIYVLEKHTSPSMNDFFPKDSEAGKLFHAIASGKVKTDDEAAKLIFNGTKEEARYTTLKRNLIRILSEIIFKSSTSTKSSMSHEKLRLIGKKGLLVVEKLLNQNVYHNAEKIVLKINTFAVKFKILDLEIECTNYLRNIYTLKGATKEVELQNLILKRLNKQLHYEQEAVGYIGILESKTKYSIGKYRQVADEAKRYSMQIREWQNEMPNPRLKFFQYKIDLIRCYHLNDLREWYYILNRISMLLDKYIFLKTEASVLYLNIAFARYMRCKANIPEAIIYVNNALQQSDYAGFNKYEVQELNFDLKIKEKKYEEAGLILLEVRESAQFYLLEPEDVAAWLLRESYLYFIFLATNDAANIKKFHASFSEQFTVTSFVESCKAVSKDKKGYNFMLMIIKEVLLSMTDVFTAEKSGKNLLIYYQRYMKDSCEHRTNFFVRKLGKYMKSSVPDKYTQRKTSDDIQSTVKCFDAAELIPYDVFYDLYVSGT